MSSTASLISRQRVSTISSTIATNGPIGFTGSARLPNLACPSQSLSTEDKETSQSSDLFSPQACDSGTSGSPGGLFQSATSLSPAGSSLPTYSDPSKTGIYLDSNAPKDQQSTCQNFGAHQFQLCWEVLNITGYVRDWVSFNQARCNGEDMGFADCFVYIEVGGGQNCTAFTGRSQCPSPDPTTFAAHFNGAQAYYVAFNIWNIQNWFFTYYLAVQGANGLVSDNVNTIARTLNLPLPPSFPVVDLLATLAFAFGLLSPSGYAAVLPRLGEKVGAQAPGEYLLRAVQNTPTLSRNLVSAGDLSKTDVQVAQLGSDLAEITSQLENNIQSSVVMVLSNFSIFFDFVQDGFFSTQIEDLNTLAANVTLSLNTYLVSQALQDDKVIITRAIDTDVNELQLNGSAVDLDTGCGNGYDEWGMCGSWWYDETSNTSYGLESLKDMMINYTDALESLFNQGITTPDLLFINSQVCADVAGSTQGSAPGTSLSTNIGVWNTECIANLKICSWDLVNLGVTNEFTDCDHESSFAMNGCGAGEDTVQVNVPASYIGPYMTSPLFEGQVCNQWGKGMGNPG